MEPFVTAEEAIEYVKTAPLGAAAFELPIAEAFTVRGRPDGMGMGMAIVLDAILGRGFMPDGFEQRVGYRLYRYKAMR